jgi:HK97 family phage major capsid protein
MKLFEMKQEHTAALDRAQSVIASAESADRKLTEQEQKLFDTHMAEAAKISARIQASESVNTLSTMVRQHGPGILLGGDPAATPGSPVGFAQPQANVIRFAEARTPEYSAALHQFLKSGGKAHDGTLTAGADGQGGFYVPGSEAYTRQLAPNGRFAATYEGYEGSSNGAGGYAVSVPTDPYIVPLALPDLGIFNASTVIPTASDLKVPIQASFGTSALKSESTGTIATFGGTDPTLAQIALTSYMIGALRLVSWELLQDVQQFNTFVVDDLLKGQRILEGQLLASGTGSGQPQGVFGNTGTGTGSAYALTGASSDATVLLDSLFDVTATLKGTYQANASWVMSRATGLSIRRAQMQTNLFVPVSTVDADGTERILGRPVYFDVNSPTLPTSTTTGVTPILFGDFKAGNLIGVRGGGGINVKILDQPWASQAQLGVLAYRRIDSRVRLTEAIQAVKFSHSY